MPVKDAASFLLSIKESTSAVWDPDAVEFLQGLVDEIRRGLDKAGLTGPDHQKEREEWLYFDAMLKGVQLKLRKASMQEQQAQQGKKDDNVTAAMQEKFH
jgi:hypothetical protein